MKLILWAMALLFVGAAVFYASQQSEPLQEQLSALLAHADATFGLLEWSALLALAAIASAAGLPRQVIALSCGNLLGGALGTLVASAIAISGCLIDFYLARYYLRPWLNHRFANRLLQLDSLLKDEPFLKALTLRLFPSGSNLLTSLLGGASSVSALPFVTGTGVGYLPQMAIFAFLGAGSTWVESNRTTLTLVMLGATVFFGLIIYRQYKANSQQS